MMNKTLAILRNLLFTALCLCFISCHKKPEKPEFKAEKKLKKTLVKYAQGFDIQVYEDYKKLVIKSPYPDAENQQEFILVTSPDKDLKSQNQLHVPVKKMVATSTTHIPMIELLGAANSLVGFPNTDYISSERTRMRIKNGEVKDLGNEQHFNTEVLISLQPDVVIAFSMGKSSKMYNTIEQNGIPVIYNGDWLEATPLGRAEWIKFFGVLFDKEKEADSIFKDIEAAYKASKKIALQASKTPDVLSGVLYKDKWNLPAGESFTAQLFKDANTNYLWSDSKGQGSLVLSFEAVFDIAAQADLWIGSGYYTSLDELKNANSHYEQFSTFKTGEIYSFSKKRSESGGVAYFEFAPIQPHIVLKDLIKVAHPELLPGYEPYFLQRLEQTP
jgi:iron complex transport system substrate-binding protein